MHPGFRGCSAEYLLGFLRSTEGEYVYLVGDITDIRHARNPGSARRAFFESHLGVCPGACAVPEFR